MPGPRLCALFAWFVSDGTIPKPPRRTAVACACTEPGRRPSAAPVVPAENDKNCEHGDNKERNMAVVMSMTWTGVTPEQYDTVREAVGWEETAPAGAQVHVAWFDAQGLHVVDVWETEQSFHSSFAERLAPAVEKAGISGTPDSGFSPLHRRFIAPGTSGAA
ncbi:hypothetical protein [Streptomyces sp. NPDC007905]|uniref:hypothetical protein n=1 Tax=Streptomyces sp. NPDC007905 TaxID=3364788 RepID=UPI0036E1B904